MVADAVAPVVMMKEVSCRPFSSHGNIAVAIAACMLAKPVANMMAVAANSQSRALANKIAWVANITAIAAAVLITRDNWPT